MTAKQGKFSIQVALLLTTSLIAVAMSNGLVDAGSKASKILGMIVVGVNALSHIVNSSNPAQTIQEMSGEIPAGTDATSTVTVKKTEASVQPAKP
jgi:hypothetical protein